MNDIFWSSCALVEGSIKLCSGVPERRKGKGGQLFQRAFLITYVQSLPPILLSSAVKQLNTSTKSEY